MFEKVRIVLVVPPDDAINEFVELFVTWDGEKKGGRRYYLFEQKVKNRWGKLSDEQRMTAAHLLVKKGIWPEEILNILAVFGGKVIGWENMRSEEVIKEKKKIGWNPSREGKLP